MDNYNYLDKCDGCHNKEWVRLFDNGNGATCANCDSNYGGK